MSRKQIPALEEARAETERWLDAVRAELGGRRHRAYSVLRAVLHGVRDLQRPDEVLRMSDLLPPLLRGLYLEGWTFSAPPAREATAQDFLTRVAERLLEVPDLQPETAVRAVLAALSRGSAAGDIPPLAAFCPPAARLFAPGSSPAIPAAPPQDAGARARREIRSALAQARAEGASERDLPEIRDEPRSARRAAGREGDVLATSLQKTAAWVRDLDDILFWNDRERAFTALTSVLQAVRDRMPPTEALHLGAQLPMALRGFYFEDWSPEGPHKERSKEAFLARVAGKARDPRIDPELATRAVFALLAYRVTEGELEDVRGRLPSAVRALWTPFRARSREAAGERAAPRRARASAGSGRARARRAKKDVRAALARARAQGVPDRDLPLLVGRRRSGRR